MTRIERKQSKNQNEDEHIIYIERERILDRTTKLIKEKKIKITSRWRQREREWSKPGGGRNVREEAVKLALIGSEQRSEWRWWLGLCCRLGM